MDEEDLMDSDLQDESDSGDVAVQALPAEAPAAPPRPVTGIDSLPPGWWIPQAPAPTVDYGRVNALRDLYNRVPTKEANSAVEMATRLEGILGFDADVKSGVTTVEALRKWAPKMYFNQPGAVSKLIAPPFQPGVTNVGGERLIQTSPNRYQVMPRPVTDTGNIQATPIVTPEGKQLGFGVRSKSGVHTRWDTPGNNLPKPSTLIQGYNAQLRSLDKAIEQASFAGDRKREAALTQESDAIRKALSDLTRNMGVPPAAVSTGTGGGVPTVTTKEQYDALPSGAIYLNGKSNRKHRKP